MAEMTPTTMATFIPEVWSKDIQMHTKDALKLATRVLRFDADVKQGGDIVHVPKVSQVAVASKSNDTDVTFTANTESEFTLTIDAHKYAAIKIADITRAQSRYDIRSLYTKSLGYSIAEAVDTSLAGLYSGLSQTVGAANTALTDAVLISGIKKLDEANAPMNERYFVARPSVKAALLALDKFTLYQNVNATRVNSGEIGEVYGVELAISNNITQTVTTVTRSNNLLFHKEAFALAMQIEPRVEAQYMARALAWELVVQALYGVAEYRDAFGVTVYTD